MKYRYWAAIFWVGFLISTCGNILLSALDSHAWPTPPSWLTAETASAVVSAVATIVIARFTVRLSRSTDLLWGEAQQAGKIAQGSLQIAQQGLELSRRSLEVTQRAFVFFSAFRPEIHKVEGEDHKFRVTGYGFSASFSNSGTTPATHVQLSTQWTRVRPGVVPHFPRPARTVTSVLGPATGGMSQPAYFSVDELAAAFLKKVDLWVWMRVDYRDVFDPSQEHHHEMCGKVSFLLDPTQVPGDGEPPYCGILITGDQNTSG